MKKKRNLGALCALSLVHTRCDLRRQPRRVLQGHFLSHKAWYLDRRKNQWGSIYALRCNTRTICAMLFPAVIQVGKCVVIGVVRYIEEPCPATASRDTGGPYPIYCDVFSRLTQTTRPTTRLMVNSMGTGSCKKKPRHSAKKKQYKKALCTARRPRDVDQIQVRGHWRVKGGTERYGDEIKA
jgi:hypothetical protein